jgi:hypothetical protein
MTTKELSMSNDSDDQVTERQSAERAPDGFSVFESMLRLIADPQAFAERMAKLKRAIEAVADGEAKLAVDRAAFEEHERTARAELESDRSALQKRREKLAGEEGTLQHHEQVLRDQQARLQRQNTLPDDWTPSAGSTITRNNPNYRGRSAPDAAAFRNDPPGPYVEKDQNKLPMRKGPPPRARVGRGSRRISA